MKIVTGSLLPLTCCLLLSCGKKENQSSIVQFRNGVLHTGVYGNADIGALSGERWHAQTGSAIRSTPAVYNGNVYAGSGDGNLYCWDAQTGREVWRFAATASVCSSPCIAGGRIYVTDRANTLFCVSARTGTLVWKKELGKPRVYDWAFDPYRSSPVADSGVLYAGSMDGKLYAMDPASGSVHWTYDAGAVILSTAAVHDHTVFIADANGRLHAVTAAAGKLKWIFRTHGDSLRNEEAGFDRKAILSTPAIHNGLVFFGGRDGWLYAVDEKSGTEKWELDYNVSWVIASAAVRGDTLVTSTSDGHYINAVDTRTGKEIWRFTIKQPAWSSPVIVSNTVLAGTGDGYIYVLDLVTGKEKSRYRLGEKIFSSPVIAGNTLYIGCDDGALYALAAETGSAPAVPAHKAVFWISNPPSAYFKYGIDLYIRDYFIAEGYSLLDAKTVDSFMRKRTDDREPSVIVFATNFFPESIVSGAYHSSIIYQYLQQGGKVLVLGQNPAVFDYDYPKNEILGFKYSRSDSILGIRYPFDDLRSNKGPLGSTVTEVGKKWGLAHTIVSQSALPPAAVTPLALNENGEAAYWVKRYDGKEGAGFVQLWFSVKNIGCMEEAKRVAEYGMK